MKRNLLRLLKLVVFGACLATLLGFCGAWSWRLDLFSHFRGIYFGLFLGLLVGFLWKKRWGWGVVALIGATINLATLGPYLMRPAPKPVPPDAIRLKIFHANVLVLNTEYEAVQRQIAAENPDIIALAELTPGWFAALEPLKKTHPFFIRNDVGDKFGLGIWSRYPLLGEAQYLGAGARCSILATVRIPNRGFTLLYTHPWPPSKPKWVEEQKRQLAAVAQRLQGTHGPKVLLGDLNATPWSYLFQNLEHDSGMRDTERDGGLALTWPEQLPLRIPIDHCLVSEEFQVVSRRAGRPTGSDHLPLILELALHSKKQTHSEKLVP